MKAIKFLIPMIALTLLASCAQMSSFVVALPAGIGNNDHEAWVKYYENLANDAKIRLEGNKRILEEYEARPYYYGKRGQDVQSHTSANIRAHEKTLKESLNYVHLHRRMAKEQLNNQINKAESNLERDFIAEKSEDSSEKL